MTFKELMQRGLIREDDDSAISGAPDLSVEAEAEPVDDTPAWAKNLTSKIDSFEERFGSIEQRLQPAAPVEVAPPDPSETPYDRLAAASYAGDAKGIKSAMDEIDAERQKQVNARFDQFGNQIGQIVAPTIKSQVVQGVAGHLNEAGQKEVLKFLDQMTPNQIAAYTQNPQAMELLANKAELAHMKAPRPTQVPASHDVSNFANNLSAADENEISGYLAAFGPMGATREMAVKALHRVKQEGN